MFDIIHATGAARDEVTVRGVEQKQVEVVDVRFAELPVPDERGRCLLYTSRCV